jgi:hypothetical protein
MDGLQIRAVRFGEEVMCLVPLLGIVPRFLSPAPRRLFAVATGRDRKEPRIATVSAEILTTNLSSSVEWHSSCSVVMARLRSSDWACVVAWAV